MTQVDRKPASLGSKASDRRPNHRLRIAAKRYLPEVIYGANDGLITTFAVVAGVTGAALDKNVILVLGIANLLADGFSMGASKYLSMRSTDDAERQSDGRARAFKAGLVTFLAFIVVGAIPIAGCVIPAGDGYRFVLTTALTFAKMFAVGAARSLVIKRPWLRAGLEMFLIGAIAAGVAYGLGMLLAGLTDGQTGAG